MGAAPSPRPPPQQNLCQGLPSWGSGRLPGNWPHSALLPQEKQSLGMAHLLPCTCERWLWRCFLHRNITAVFLQLSAVTNGSLSILNNILNNCGFFGSICSVILPGLKQSCAAPQSDGSDRSCAFVQQIEQGHQSLFALHCIYEHNKVIALVFTERLSCISKKSHINYLQMSGLFLPIDFPEVAKCFSLCSRLFIKCKMYFSLCLVAQTVRFVKGLKATSYCSSLHPSTGF